MIEFKVVNRLLRWQRWKLASGVMLGFATQSPLMKLTPKDNNPPDPGYDLDCELTNRAYEKHLPAIYQLVIWIEYISLLTSEDQRSRYYGKSRRTYRQDRTRAHELLGNIIDTLTSNPLEESEDQLEGTA